MRLSWLAFTRSLALNLVHTSLPSFFVFANLESIPPAAHFVQCLIASYERHCGALKGCDSPQPAANEPKGKECLNLIVLLSELYNFRVVSCVLVYDIIRGLLSTLDEFDVELLLKVTRSMYSSL